MSSTAYSAELRPDPLLRRVVLWSGIVFAVVGILVILILPLAWWVRLTLSAGWVAVGCRERRQLQRGWAACDRLRFDSTGKIGVQDAGEWHEAQWESGGVLLRKAGWIRLRNHHGLVFGELLSGDARTSPDWRRLQVIWRHIGA